VNRSTPRFLVLAAATALVTTGLAGAAQAAGPELIKNGTFDSGTAPWWWTGNAPSSNVNGQMCAQIPAGTVNPWDAIVGQNDLTLQKGESYEFSFDASASVPVGVLAKVQLQVDPFSEQLSRPTTLGPAPQHFSYTFTSGVDSAIEQVAFQVGGSTTAWTLCLDNVSLTGGAPPPVYVPDTGPRVRVNQVGYLAKGPKAATLVTAATDPLPWQLADAAGNVVASGMTTPRGMDQASNQNVQTIDFSGVTATGSGFTLTADGQTSYPFAIGDVYSRLRSDALQFFYIQRSGIAIDGSLVGAQYARPAGHAGVAPNQGDVSVPCQPGVCDYRLDVHGGWYDAGDHGKYVVNGGIATAQLLSTFERTLTARSVAPNALGDSTLRVPERGNSVPDILDEARWELDFLMRMQVPAGQPLAGMAHHKVHDQNWTGLPLAPEADPQLRELHPPSTAATLNLAATAAQCARLFLPYDTAFGNRCLTAARTAYAAAKAHPNMLASPSDGNGGGTYDDGNVTDEFYWAAAELFITTGEQSYLTDLQASPMHTANVFDASGFSWQSTAALGRLDLATVPNGLPAADRARVKQSVVDAANAYLATESTQSYGLPMGGEAGSYFWGANSNIINNDVVLATAFDLTGNQTFRDGAVRGMDYIFGRNALNHSYVTGWGTVSSQNQHSRIYGHELNPNLPHPPAGSLSGGANAGLQDPFAANLLKGCAPAFCYVDDIQSYSTNEVAINWNSALVWMSSFLADQGDGTAAAPGGCQVRYVVHGSWPNGFTAQVWLTNTGTTALDGWNVSWSFPDAQGITNIWSVDAKLSGATLTAANLPWNKRIEPGATITFGFNGLTRLANPNPELFRVSGSACP
jgi:endoglucanase